MTSVFIRCLEYWPVKKKQHISKIELTHIRICGTKTAGITELKEVILAGEQAMSDSTPIHGATHGLKVTLGITELPRLMMQRRCLSFTEEEHN